MLGRGVVNPRWGAVAWRLLVTKYCTTDFLYFISVPLRRRITQKSGDDVVTGADLVVSLEYILTQLSMSIVALYRTSTSRRDGDTGSHGRATGQFPPRSRTVASRGPRS